MENTQPAGAGVEVSVTEAPQTAANDTPSEQPETQAEKPDPTQDELKKLRNALDRKNREMGKKTAQKHQLQQELEQARQELNKYRQPQSGTAPQQPSPEQFPNDYEAYKRAHNEWVEKVLDARVDQKFTKKQEAEKEERTKAEQQAWREDREAHLSENAAKAREQIPDFQKVLQDNQHLMAEMPPHVVDAFLDSDEPAFAFHQMIQDGTIDQLLQAPNERRAAALIAKAELKATAPKQSPPTKAPAPLSANKGTTPGSKPLGSKSYDELKQWLNEK